MRFYFLTVFYFINSFFAEGQSFTFDLQGKFLEDTTAGMVYLYFPTEVGWTKDSCQVDRGIFSFTGKLIHPVLVRLVYQNKEKEIFIEPTKMSMAIKSKGFEQIEISGSNSHQDFEIISKSLQSINKRWKSVMDTLYIVNKRSNTDFQELREWVLVPYFQEVREVYLGFFQQNPNSFVSAYFLSINVIEMNQGSLRDETLEQYYRGFPPSIMSSLYGKRIQIELEKRKTAIPGTLSIEFAKPDLKGKPLSLLSFRGKYVLLDFWGSWCVPCRKENPHLKQLYYEYKDKGFDIIGIAADDRTQNAWREAIEKDALPWHHVLLGNLGTLYNITSYPTKILIDRQGIIIGRYGTEYKELDIQLKKEMNSF